MCLVTLGAYAKSGTYYIVDASSLNVRQKPSTDGAVIGKVTKGQELLVMSISNGWAYITYQKGFGYVSAQYLKKKYGGSTATSSTASSSTASKSSTATKSSTTSKSNTPSKGSTSSASSGFPYSDGRGARYGGWTEVGANFRAGAGGFTLDVVNGCYIRDYIFAGAGIGLRGLFGGGSGLIAVPIYAQARGVLRVNQYVAPFVDLGIGGYAGFAYTWGESAGAGGGFYMRVAPGVRFGNHFHISLGYERCVTNTGVFTIGADW